MEGLVDVQWPRCRAQRHGLYIYIYIYIGSSIHGGAAQLYQYDPRTDRIRHIADIVDFLGMSGRGIRLPGKIHTCFVEDRQGRIYFGTM